MEPNKENKNDIKKDPIKKPGVTKKPVKETSTKAKEEKKEKSGSKLPLILLIFSLLINIGLIAGLVLINNSNTAQESEIRELRAEIGKIDSEVSTKANELSEIRDELDRIRAERDQLGLENSDLDAKIAELNNTITTLRRSSALTSKSKKEVDQLISKLRKEIAEKDKEIAKLHQENDSLSTNISHLNEEKLQLGDSLSTTMKALKDASILKAENLEILGVKSNGKEMDKPTLRGRRVEQLRINFNLADNKAAKKEKKKFYVALVLPSGETFSDIANGGGTTTLADGTDIFYTLSQNIDFDNTGQQLTFDMLKGFNYTEGNYYVNIYSEGHLIGEGGFSIK
ncbi:hypothetical protein RCC89_05450 [Cytophagaceae bacterium ABcell3]|nr:hypothetical protein RCC89_05450 [Cytophagaceae bacterium ABcell3]